jgi:hypothetical protein
MAKGRRLSIRSSCAPEWIRRIGLKYRIHCEPDPKTVPHHATALSPFSSKNALAFEKCLHPKNPW